MFSSIEYEIKKKRKIEYINIECGFDIETTSTEIEGIKFSNMYLWCMGFGNGDLMYYGRSWDEFQELCYTLSNELNLHEGRRIICYVHNLGYEFQFMRKYFDWVEGGIFSSKERKPMKALTKIGIEFRDSLILSGNSLKVVAKNLHKKEHKIEKLIGDLDYKLIRHHKTEITESELKYLENDVKIILYYINEEIEKYGGNITKIPLTNTGRVRELVRQNCFYGKGNDSRTGSKGKYKRYRKLMQQLTIEPTEYLALKQTFMGGFTHANAFHTDKTLHDVHSIDFTSSYPAVMVSEEFPMSKGIRISDEELEENGIKYYLDNFCCMFAVEFTKLQNVFHWESYFSLNEGSQKCIVEGERFINNGRVYKADKLITSITNIDFDIVRRVYKWQDMKVKNLIVYKKGYLPKAIIESILELYQKKTELKDVKGKEPEYQNSKGMLNSIYGMTVTDIVQNDVVYDNESNEWGQNEVDYDEKINKGYNEKHNRFLFYPWGIWVTAYARWNLWSGILTMGKDYIYADTDSLKFFNLDKYENYIKAYNNMIMEKQMNCLKYYELDTKLLTPKTVEGIEKPLGVWDYEGNYRKFKTLGAKRYLVEEFNNKSKEWEIKITVAGLPKKNGRDYLLMISDNDHDKVFDNFTDNLVVPKEYTGKLVHTYEDEEYEFTLTDYNGVSELVSSKSYTHLDDTEFSMNLDDMYIKFFTDMQKGIRYFGDDMM